MKGLSGKVAVVTGGGQGIGRGLTLRLAEEGCKVAIFDINPQAGEETAGLLPTAVIKTYAVDVGDAASVNAAVSAVEAELGPIWLLVNARGAVGLVVAKVGLDTGLLSDKGFALVVLVIVLTTLLAAPALSWHVRRVGVQAL